MWNLVVLRYGANCSASVCCVVHYLIYWYEQSWKWVIVPLFFYLVERLLRVYRSWQTVVITKVGCSQGTRLA